MIVRGFSRRLSRTQELGKDRTILYSYSTCGRRLVTPPTGGWVRRAGFFSFGGCAAADFGLIRQRSACGKVIRVEKEKKLPGVLISVSSH